jgi:AcrR family transcriptional regulator
VVQAARKVFEKKGYLPARVADIARSARVAHGTFYTYFSSKEDVFREIAVRLDAERSRQRSRSPGAHETPEQRVARANRGYFQFYKQNATILGVLEQVSSYHGEFRELRSEMRRDIYARSARAIGRLQEQGLVSADLDPRHTAAALGAMVDHFCYLWLVLGESFDEETALVTLDQLCIRALGLDHRPGPGTAGRRVGR